MIVSENVLVVDVDGTLCPVKGSHENYPDLPFEPRLVEKIRTLHADGWHIILHSSRGMRTYGGNVGALYRHVLPVMLDWLDKHNIPFNEIMLGKPWAGRNGFYIDDRAVRPREFLENDFDALNEIIARDRLARSDT